MNIFLKLKPIPIFCYDQNNLRPLPLSPLSGRDRVGCNCELIKSNLLGIHMNIKIKKIPSGRNYDQGR